MHKIKDTAVKIMQRLKNKGGGGGWGLTEKCFMKTLNYASLSAIPSNVGVDAAYLTPFLSTYINTPRP